jgi:CelD/BcsL family acetyltransferase involved in cellulose biosynthesis
VAAEIGFHHNGHYVSYLGAFASDLCAYSPGRLQIRATIDWCIAKGLSSYDLLAPDDAYKYDWSTGAAGVRTFVLVKTWRGQAAAFGVRLRPEAKRLYHSLPKSARRLLGHLARA